MYILPSGDMIANSFDADADKVMVHLEDRSNLEIIVSDDGHGMTLEEINDKFLRIGRNRRDEEDSQDSPGGRKVIGKKGLGKLSFFGIAHEIEVSTVKNGLRNTFVLNWDAIKNHKDDDDSDPTSSRNYHPHVEELNVDADGDSDGTTMTLRQIQRQTGFDGEAIADSLSKIFIVDPDFKIIVQRNDDAEIVIDNDRKYSSLDIDIEWNVPEDVAQAPSITYLTDNGITGHLIAATKPISPKTNMRGVTLFSRKKLVNLPDYFSDSTSSHFYSYLTGYLEVNFIDEIEDDVIGTNRQSLDWNHPAIAELRKHLGQLLNWLERDWRRRRSEKRKEELKATTGITIDDWLERMPGGISDKVRPIVQALVTESELPVETNQRIVKDFHELIPEYPYFHWRHLHPKIQQVSKIYYQSGDYYTAFFEAVKSYINAVRRKSGVTTAFVQDDNAMMEKVFKMSAPLLSVTDNYKRADGSDFEVLLIKDIKNAQARFSTGVVLGGRNVVAHEEVIELREVKLFTEQDCLDMLSLLSHLYSRLDNSVRTSNPIP